MPVDVLDRHGPVIDENADGKREPAEGHHVDGFAEPGQRRQREKDRQRNLDQDDHGRAPAAKEEQDHHADKAAASAASRSTPKIAALTKID